MAWNREKGYGGKLERGLTKQQLTGMCWQFTNTGSLQISRREIFWRRVSEAVINIRHNGIIVALQIALNEIKGKNPLTIDSNYKYIIITKRIGINLTKEALRYVH